MKGLGAARVATDRNPSKEQIEAGNYRHGKVQIHGLTVSLENPKGSVRRGIGRNGLMWETKMTADYGRILGTEGADGEHVDVFIGPDHDSELVYVVDQVHSGGRFDEHKVLLGTDSEAEARALYLAHYAAGWQGLGNITSLTLDEFKAWLEHHDTSKPIASKKLAPRHVFKSIWNMVVKATQFGLFGPAEEVKEPGKRGGRYYRTGTGHVRYGEKPIGKPSLPEKTLTPEEDYKKHGVHAERFVKWFGKSKVIDEHGDPKETYPKPIVVYHGSRQKFEAFDPQKELPGLYGKGFYFTEDRAVAEGEWEDVEDWSYHATREAAQASEHVGFVWQEDIATGPQIAGKEITRENMWIARVKKRKLKRPGYAGDPNRIEIIFPRWRTGLADKIEQELQGRGEHYLSPSEHEYVNRYVSDLRNGAPGKMRFEMLSDVNALSEQPYNIPVMRLAEEVGIPVSGHVYACYLSVQHPLVIDDPDPNMPDRAERHLYEGDEWNAIHERIANTARHWAHHGDVWLTTDYETHELSRAMLPHLNVARIAGEELFQVIAGSVGKSFVNDFLADAGFDGITHVGGQVSQGKKHRVWIVFRSTQAKAVENLGTFDPTNPDLFKAEQFSLFGPRPEVQQPGIRGGRYYVTAAGHVRYGEKPLPGEKLLEVPEHSNEPGEAVDPLGMVRLKPVEQFVVSPTGIVASLNEAERATQEHRQRIGAALDVLPDGILIEQWKKFSVAGETKGFWEKQVAHVPGKPSGVAYVPSSGLAEMVGTDALISHVGREVLGLKSEEQIATERAEEPDLKTAAKLRGLADAMAEQVDKYQDSGVSRQHLTARRANIAANVAQHGDWLADVRAILYGLADLHENGKVPVVLRTVKSRALIEDLLNSPPDVGYPQHGELMNRKSRFPYARVDRHYIDEVKTRSKGVSIPPEVRRVFDLVALREVDQYGNTRLHSLEEIEAVEFVAKKLVGTKDQYGHADDYYARQVVGDFGRPKRALKAGLDTEEKWDAAAVAIQDFRKVTDRSATRKIQELERALIGRKIPGYFPTPTVTVEHLLDLADIQPGETILEPSAGKGNIADVIHAQHPENELWVIERNADLAAILEAKGYKSWGDVMPHGVAGRRYLVDFMEWRGRMFDRIIMNPPFEDGQDVEHVKHAYDNALMPGGRLVSVMGEHVFFANDKRSVEFRQWLDAHGARVEKLPAGSFLSSERSTGVNARVVVIDKGSEDLSKSAERQDVLHPGIRGGHYYIDQRGMVRYGDPPVGLRIFSAGASSRTQTAMLGRSKGGFFAGRRINKPEESAAVFRDIVNLDRERFWMLHLSKQNVPKAIECVSQGALSASIVHPREVFKNAIQLGTGAVALVHNHPSGNMRPSPEDSAMSARLKSVGDRIGIAVQYHVIVTPTGFTELAADGGVVGTELWQEPVTVGKRLREVEGRLVATEHGTPWEGVFGVKLGSAAAVAQVGRKLLDPGDSMAVLLVLNQDNVLMGVYPVAHGELNNPLEVTNRVVRLALGASAAAIVLVAGKDGVAWTLGVHRLHAEVAAAMQIAGVRHLDTVSVGEGGRLMSMEEDGSVMWPYGDASPGPVPSPGGSESDQMRSSATG